eukprot:1558618-Alexandrium_andersonii.AAC.2
MPVLALPLLSCLPCLPLALACVLERAARLNIAPVVFELPVRTLVLLACLVVLASFLPAWLPHRLLVCMSLCPSSKFTTAHAKTVG